MVAPSQSSSGASQTPPSDNNPTANKINRATEHARLAATDDAFDSLSDISHVGYEHADQFDLLLDFDDLHTEDMDVDEDPEPVKK
ncbi:hypothetical protein BG003_000059 [Podila horticola]|nr:hypothetical protein BG003_000059 [Podila horticola]